MFEALKARFQRPTIRTLAEDELYDAILNLLAAQARSEAAEADVATYTKQVNRLKAFLKEEKDASSEQDS
jgi:ribosomal protein S15P/S13E